MSREGTGRSQSARLRLTGVLTFALAGAIALGVLTWRTHHPLSSLLDATRPKASPGVLVRRLRDPHAPGWPAHIRVVGLGDSVMAGTHCGCAGPVAEYADALARSTGRKVTSMNLGVNGATTSTLLRDLQTDSTTREAVARARVVLVIVGANDLYPQLDQFRASSCADTCFGPATQKMGERLQQILTEIQSLREGVATTILVCTYWNVFTDGQVALSTHGPREHDWSVDVTRAANAAITAAATARSATLVDLYEPFERTGNPTDLLASDGDHPNAAGVQVLTKALLVATQP